MNQGFGNLFSSEAIENTLPKNQNSPKQMQHGLYAEQISGSAFTKPRHQNLKTWVYRTKPSVSHTEHFKFSKLQWIKTILNPMPPNPMRLSPRGKPDQKHNFIENIFHLASSGVDKHIYWYDFQNNMEHEYFSNYDGELLFLPFTNKIKIKTEFGKMGCEPGQMIVIPRGVAFKIQTNDKYAAGYLVENGGAPLKLPELGLIGANGLAHPRHFYYPTAAYEDKSIEGIHYVKFQNNLFEKNINHSPLNVVAWCGNYAPYFYDFKNFNPINTVSFDHPDPSIFSVLTSESSIPGVASLDFVIFPPRVSVAKHTFRIPYFHRNVMNELMGLIQGEYDAKGKEFSAGGISIHNMMTPHGPDFESWRKEAASDDKPIEICDSLAFMLESNEIWRITEQAYHLPEYQKNYTDCWNNFPEAKLK